MKLKVYDKKNPDRLLGTFEMSDAARTYSDVFTVPVLKQLHQLCEPVAPCAASPVELVRFHLSVRTRNEKGASAYTVDNTAHHYN